MLLAVGFVLGASAPLWSQAAATPPLPAWQDGASVYLKADRPVAAPAAERMPQASAVTNQTPERPVSPAAYAAPTTTSAAAAAPDAPPTAEHDGRLLPPPSSRELAPGGERFSTPAKLLPGLGVPLDSTYTMLTGLAMVVGLFLLCAWALRRGVRSSSAVLPGEVVSVLGRVPLAARQFAQLLRVGNKLVLVSITPSGAETLAEVTDPSEVDRLLGICQQHDPKSTTREFEQVFRQLAGKKTPDAFIERDAPVDQDAYAAYRGGTVRG